MPEEASKQHFPEDGGWGVLRPDALDEETRLRRMQQEYPKFEPDGEGYDYETADKLIDERPLTMPKPPIPSYGERATGVAPQSNEGAFQSWQWHEDEQDWGIHWPSRDPDTGLLLKGRGHETWDLLEKGEADAGYHIYQDPQTKRYKSEKIGPPFLEQDK